MTAPLAIVRADGPIYRVARRPDPWAWPDWGYAHEDGTFGARFDDPRAEYRVLYASSQLEGAFAETLARYRVDLHVEAELRMIDGDSDDQHYPEAVPAGVVPKEWLAARLVGIATHQSAFVDVGHSDSLSHLREVLASRVLHHGLDELDGGTLRRSAPRSFTQEISRYVFEHGRDDAGRTVAGMRYLSRLGDELVNWAMFEPNTPSGPRSEEIDPESDALRAVLRRFDLSWG